MTNNIRPGSGFYEIDIYSSDYNDITDPDYVQFYLKVWLDDYYLDNPAGAIHWEPFRVKIESDNCIVTSFTAPAVSDLAYQVYYPAETRTIAAFTQASADCSYLVTYTAQWITYQNSVKTDPDLPPFLTWDLGTMTFTVDTDNIEYVTDTYTTYGIELVGVIGNDLTYIPVTATATFTVTVTNPCLISPGITTQEPITATVYPIGSSAATITLTHYLSATETANPSKVGACGPIVTEYYLLDDNAVYYQLNFTDYPYLSYNDDGSNHVLTIDTSDVQYTTNNPFSIYARSYLVDYISEDPDESFSVIYDEISIDLTNCEATLTAPSDPAAQSVVIFDHVATVVNIAAYTQAGSCAYTVTYTADWINYYDHTVTTIPDWVTFSGSDGSTNNVFSMITSDISDADTW
jgi:hypothetical protein